MGTVTCTIILKSIMSISDISLVFLNYCLGIGLHTCLFMFDKKADSLHRKMRDAICPYVLKSKESISLLHRTHASFV